MSQQTIKHTRRYIQAEQKLITVASKIFNPLKAAHITVKELARQAKVGTSTFYRHFHSLIDFFHRHEKILKTASEHLVSDLSDKNLPPEKLFFQISRLLYLNRASVTFMFASKNDRVIRQIFWIFRPLITKNWPTYGHASDQRIYCFFVAEATEIIRLWAIGYDFQQDRVSEITRQLSFISKALAPTLAPIIVAKTTKPDPLPENYI